MNEIVRLVLANQQVKIDIFLDYLFDPPEAFYSLTALSNSNSLTRVRATVATQQLVQSIQVIDLKTQSKKRVTAKAKGSNLRNRLRNSTIVAANPPSPPMQMKLIWLRKKKVKVPANVIENT